MGFFLLPNKALKWVREALIWGLYKLDFVEDGHVLIGQVGFSLLLNKAFKCGRQAWIRVSHTLDFVQGGGRKKNPGYHRFFVPLPPRGGTARKKTSHPYV